MRMFPRMKKKFMFLLLVIAAFITTWFTIFQRPLAAPLLFTEMKTSLKAGVRTWFNLAHLVQRHSLVVVNAAEWLAQAAEWEENLLNFTWLESDDPLMMSNATMSSVMLLNNTLQFREREVVAVRIDVRNGYGIAQERGGDDVRVWLTDPEKHSLLVASVADLKNGTFIASFPTLFSGSAEIKAALAYSKELLGTVTYSLRNGVIHFVAGLFEKRSHSELTLCAVFPSLPNYTKICNFTSENNNMSWYCGHPFSRYLSCQDWVSEKILPAPLVPSLPVGNHSISQLHQLSQENSYIPSYLKINITHKDQVSKTLELPPCTLRSRPLSQSWMEHSPRGWIGNGKWHPRSCHMMDMSEHLLYHCLNSTTIALLGSSAQTEGMFRGLRKITECKIEGEVHRMCVKESWTFKIMMQLLEPLAQPLYDGKHKWVPRSEMSSAAWRIPETGKTVVVIDHSLPMTTVHHSVYRTSVQKAVQVVEHLMDQNSQVFVAVLGPVAGQHVGKGNAMPDKSMDYFVSNYIDILKEEYIKLRKDVLFLDGWDITSAGYPPYFNSVSHIYQQNAGLMLNYACDFFR